MKLMFTSPAPQGCDDAHMWWCKGIWKTKNLDKSVWIFLISHVRMHYYSLCSGWMRWSHGHKESYNSGGGCVVSLSVWILVSWKSFLPRNRNAKESSCLLPLPLTPALDLLVIIWTLVLCTTCVFALNGFWPEPSSHQNLLTVISLDNSCCVSEVSPDVNSSRRLALTLLPCRNHHSLESIACPWISLLLNFSWSIIIINCMCFCRL
jgi:hypothetical protein